MEWNKSLTISDLDVDNSHIYLPDTNHNASNLRHLLICGSYPATIGNFFGPYLFVLAGVANDLVRYQYFLLDDDFLCLGLHQKTKKLCVLNSSDVGNFSFMVVYLTMIRMSLFAVNSQNTPWKVREITTYM